MHDEPSSSRAGRQDAALNRERILEVAAQLLASDADVSLDEVASAAGLGRATVYRHFGTRSRLLDAARVHAAGRADANERDALRPAGELASRGPVPLDVADVLNKVPPFLLGEQVVAEAQRLAGVRSVAVYLVDIDGTRLLRLAGSEEFPDELPLALAVGPELPREAIPALRAELADRLPGSTLAPLSLRGRAIGVLLAVDGPEGALVELARQAAATLALADRYTDLFDATRRRRETSAASEVQQGSLPPRIARISGAVLAGNVLPGYEIGGDWFDYCENPDGVWLAVADSMGTGTKAAAAGAVLLGAFRAKRRAGASLQEVVRGMDATLRELEVPEAAAHVTVARWHGPTASLFWIACGGQRPLLVSADGVVSELEASHPGALGRDELPAELRVCSRRVDRAERLLLLSDGVLDRRRRTGATLGLEGVQEAVRSTPGRSAPELVAAIQRQLWAVSDELLADDAAVLAFAPTARA